jgi:hypothetical protein
MTVRRPPPFGDLGEFVLLYYRLYFLDPRGNHILRFAEFEAADDEAAIALAAGEEGPQPLELWCRQRKVKRFESCAGQRRRAEPAAASSTPG